MISTMTETIFCVIGNLDLGETLDRKSTFFLSFFFSFFHVYRHRAQVLLYSPLPSIPNPASYILQITT